MKGKIGTDAIMNNEIINIAYNIKTDNTEKMRILINWIKKLQKGRSIVDVLIDNNIDGIIVYGVAELGQLLIYEALEKDYPIYAIVDKKIQYGDYMYRNIPIINISRLKSEQYKNKMVVITAMSFYQEIAKKLEKMDIRNYIGITELLKE